MLYCALFGMIASVGLSNLQFVDLNSARNLFVIGFAFFMGLSLPEYFAANPVAIEGHQWASDIINAIGNSGMSVGAAVALTLDNTIPGTDEERGLIAWSAGGHSDEAADDDAPAPADDDNGNDSNA